MKGKWWGIAKYVKFTRNKAQSTVMIAHYALKTMIIIAHGQVSVLEKVTLFDFIVFWLDCLVWLFLQVLVFRGDLELIKYLLQGKEEEWEEPVDLFKFLLFRFKNIQLYCFIPLYLL